LVCNQPSTLGCLNPRPANLEPDVGSLWGPFAAPSASIPPPNKAPQPLPPITNLGYKGAREGSPLGFIDGPDTTPPECHEDGTNHPLGERLRDAKRVADQQAAGIMKDVMSGIPSVRAIKKICEYALETLN